MFQSSLRQRGVCLLPVWFTNNIIEKVERFSSKCIRCCGYRSTELCNVVSATQIQNERETFLLRTMFSTTSSTHASSITSSSTAPLGSTEDDKQLGLTACHFLKHMGAQYDVDLTQPGYESRLAHQLCANDEDTLMIYIDNNSSAAGPDDNSVLENALLYSRIHDRILELARYCPTRLGAAHTSMNPAWFSLRLLLTTFYPPAEEPHLTAQLDELIRLANVAMTCIPVYTVKTVADMMRKDLDPFPLYLKPFVTAVGDSVLEQLIAAHHTHHGTHPPAATCPPTPIEYRAPMMAIVSNEYLEFWRGWVGFAHKHLMVVFASVIDPPDTPATLHAPGAPSLSDTANPPPPSLLTQPVTKVLPPLTLLRCATGSDSTAAIAAAAAGTITVRVSLPTPLKPFSNKYKTKFRNLIPQVSAATHAMFVRIQPPHLTPSHFLSLSTLSFRNIIPQVSAATQSSPTQTSPVLVSLHPHVSLPHTLYTLVRTVSSS